MIVGSGSRLVRSSAVSTAASHREDGAAAPARAGLVLAALIIVAGVANLNLSVANVALPDIGKHFDSSQTTLDLIAVGYSLGLACSVLWLGALGDRYGRKLMLILGTALAIPMSLLAAYAPNDIVLFAARVGGGIAAGMAYPTTLALIAALWAGPGRTKSIALWSALGGAIASLGPLLSGFLLEHFYWGSVFLITLPLAVVAILMAVWLVPAHVNESAEPVDNLGGILSLVLVGALILSINFAPVPNQGKLTIVLAVIALASLAFFYFRQRRATNPLYDLDVASRPTFWVAACAGIIRLRGHHRLRLLDGSGVREPAVPAERARVLDARGRRRVPARGLLHGARRAAVGEARRGARRPLYASVRLRLPAARLRDDAARLEGGQ